MLGKSVYGKFFFDFHGGGSGICIVGTEHNEPFPQDGLTQAELVQSVSSTDEISILLGYDNLRCVLIVHFGECLGAECGCVECARHILRSDQPPVSLETYIHENGPKLNDSLDFPYLLLIIQGDKAVQVYCNDGADFSLEFVDPGTYSIE